MKNNIIFTIALYLLIQCPLHAAHRTLCSGGIAHNEIYGKTCGQPNIEIKAHSHFGWAVSISGNFAAISAPMEVVDNVEAGCVYIYQKSNNWNFYQKIIPENPERLQCFGETVKLYQNTLMIGSYKDRRNSGSVTVYEFNGAQWIQAQELLPEKPIFFQQFGMSLDYTENMAIIASRGADATGNASGIIYVFNKSDDGWIQQDMILSPGSNKNDLFGASCVIVNQNHVLVAAPRGNSQMNEAGLVYSFVKENDEWILNQTLAASVARKNGLFGSSIAYSNNRLIVGAMESVVDTLYSGEANLYQLNAFEKWDHQYRFIPESPQHHAYFGGEVAIDNDYILISSPKHDKALDDKDHGAVYIFMSIDSTWQNAGQIIPEDVGEDDNFGMALSIDGNSMVVGSSLNDTPYFNSGSAYFYEMDALITGVAKTIIPNTFALYQNYPNPFNPKTIIRYDLPIPTHVTISIFDLLGRKVAQLIDRVESAGNKQIVWDGKGFNGKQLSSGAYIYRVECENFNESKKMLLLK